MTNHGGAKYRHDIIGWNSRLDALQAVVLRSKLTRLARWNLARRSAAKRYQALLEPIEVARLTVLDGNDQAWHLYVIRIPGHSPPRPRSGPARRRGHRRGRPLPRPRSTAHQRSRISTIRRGTAAHRGQRVLSLPLYPHIRPHQQEFVVDRLVALHEA